MDLKSWIASKANMLLYKVMLYTFTVINIQVFNILCAYIRQEFT